MRVSTEVIIDIESGAVISRKSFIYSGPLMLCDRGQSTAAFNQAQGAAAEDQGNAQTALANTNTALANYSSNLGNFMNFGRATYGPNGTYMADQNAIANTAAHATAGTLSGQMALNAQRTGENTASYAPSAQAAKQQGQIDQTSGLATADANRLQALTNINQYGVQASALPAQVQSSLYGTGTSGAGGQQSTATQAAAVPSGWQVFGQDLAAAGGAAIGAFCPCEGSMILLADGSELRVETLIASEKLKAFGKQPPNSLTAKPVAKLAECFEIQLGRGWFHRGSATHTLALDGGGYAYMPELKGKKVLTTKGAVEVLSVESIGEKWVYPLGIDGSHCYIADACYCLA
jgi:hypothetical protein